MNVTVLNKKEVTMTEKLTPIEILKNKKNFSEFIEDYNPVKVISTLAEYPQSDGKVIARITDLTQNFDSFVNLMSDPVITNLKQMPFITWFIVNEKENILNTLANLNKFASKEFGIFVFKVFLNDEQIDVKCILKPELKSVGGIAKQYQPAYWTEFNKVNISKKLGWKISQKTQHWQYLPIGKRSVSVMLSVNTQDKLIGADLIINYDESIYNNLYSHKDEIEKELGTLDWVQKNKSCRIRKSISCDITDLNTYQETIEKHIELTLEFKEVLSRYLK